MPLLLPTNLLTDHASDSDSLLGAYRDSYHAVLMHHNHNLAGLSKECFAKRAVYKLLQVESSERLHTWLWPCIR